MKFLMITSWQRHWDNLAVWDNLTLFTTGMIHWPYANNLPATPVETIFVKKSGNNFEGAWIGTVSAFHDYMYQDSKPSIRFTVSIKSKYDCPSKLKQMKLGWHLIEDSAAHSTAANDSHTVFNPPFFADFQTTKWEVFEDSTYYLLRLLGIHDIHKFAQGNNRGKADGFFKFDNRLAVLYDATLDTDLSKKKTQISNYLNQLSEDKFQHGISSYSIKGIDKQVWIIVKDGSKASIIQNHDGIKVKTIPISVLLSLYHERLSTEIGTDQLWDKLKDL